MFWKQEGGLPSHRLSQSVLGDTAGEAGGGAAEPECELSGSKDGLTC